MGQASTSRADIIDRLDSVIRRIDNACTLVEAGKTGESLGVLHSALSTLDTLELQLLTEEANARAEEQERAEQEAVLR